MTVQSVCPLITKSRGILRLKRLFVKDFAVKVMNWGERGFANNENKWKKKSV